MERVTVGDEKLSLTITRKTKDDLLVSQYAIERWFPSEEAVLEALLKIMTAVSEWKDGEGATPS